MKYLFTYLFSMFLISAFCQVEVEVDSAIVDFKEYFCMEDKNVMYNWVEIPDKVLIRMFNRFGDVLIESNEMSLSFSSFIDKKINTNNETSQIIKGNQLVSGTYFLLVEFEKNETKKYFKHFIYLTRFCACG